MTATAGRLTAAGPRPKELWLTVGLSILLHGLLLLAVVMVPRFRFGTYVTVPVNYTVDLVSATPGGRAGASAPAKAPSVPAARPAPPAPAPRAAPAPPPPPAARSSEELTLPGKRPPQKAPPEIEPSLRLPLVAGREKQQPAPADLRPRPPVAAQAPAAPVTPAAPPVASAAPAAAPAGSAETASGKASGLELASGDRGEGSGGSALGYYLGLVDYKISTNWNPVATGGAQDSVAVVRFRVLRSGNIRDVEMETSSGDAGLDAAAMRAIRQSLPLPPFPNLLTEPFLNLRYRFVVERG